MRTRNIGLVVAAAAVVLCAVVATVITKERQEKQAQTKFDPMYPYGRDGRDMRHAGQTIDMMFQSIHDQTKLAAAHCNKHHIRGAERSKIIMGTFEAGIAAQKQVSASNYTIPFQPHYPPLPR